MGNLEIWDKVKAVPKEYTKKITGGRLKGMTDIKPQWRLLTLTSTFGPCGVGWFYEITDKWTEQAGEEVSAYISINLYIKQSEEWSKPIPGLGGSKLLAQESKGPHHSDECYKMALTDALSVACKQLGIASDIYMGWDAVETKQPMLKTVDTEKLKKIKAFYIKRGDAVKTDFIESILEGKNVKHIKRVYDGYAVDSAKSTFQKEDSKELMEDLALEEKELF